jgi:predicted TIM-barrel fold metal-dependent hydrolase
MRKSVIAVFLIFCAVAAGIISRGRLRGLASPAANAKSGLFSPAELRAFAALDPVDTHAHVFKNDPAVYAMLRRLHLHILTICVIDDHVPYMNGLEPQLHDALAVVHSSQGHAALCTTFNPYKFRDPGFTASVIRQINENFREGAIAVKIWKNIGMELRWPSGKYVMPDDPIFEPIYKDIAVHHRTLIAHLAEPDSCWESFAQMGSESPDYEYYKTHPFWHMYGKPNGPSKAEILAARDHLVAENPGLRVVGAHLGSMELHLNEIARDFNRYPNFAVDTAARVPYLMLKPREQVRAFMIKYQDRILYGTDIQFYPGANTEHSLKEWEQYYARDWRFFATDDVLAYGGHEVRGLGLPEPVLRKLYHANAVRWFPGILDGAAVYQGTTSVAPQRMPPTMWALESV